MFDLLETLLRGLFGPFIPLLQAVMPYAPFILIGLVAVACGIRFGTPFLLGLVRRLVTRTPRSLFKAKAELLTNDAICEMYAPANQYITDREEGKKGGAQFAWLSPFPRAVKRSIKRNPVSRNRKLNARAQVAAAAKHIHVREPHPADNVAGELSEHYRIDMRLDGHDPKEIESMLGRVKAQLGLREIERIKTSDTYTLSMIAHKTDPEDILLSRKSGVELFEENPAETPISLPMALREDGKVWSLPTHHSLFFGATGSGKGGPLHAVVRQMAPFYEQGRVKFYGIDPKMIELRPYAETAMFETMVQDPEDAQEVIAHVYKLMNDRSRNIKIDLENDDLKRSLSATRETPMVILMIDEMLDLLLGLKGLGKPGVATMNQLTGILAKGRSLGIYVMAATQAVDTELLGRMRVNFANVVILQQGSAYYNDLFLGDGAAKRGFNSTAIPVSTPANKYKWAGIGYVKEPSGDPVKVRFAYSSDKDIIKLIKRYPKDDSDSFDYLPSLPNVDVDSSQDTSELPDLKDDEEADA